MYPKSTMLDVEVDTRDESKDLPGETPVRSPVFDVGENMDFRGKQAHIVSRKPARQAKGKVLRICNRKGGTRHLRSTENVVSQSPSGIKWSAIGPGKSFGRS